MVGDDWVWNIIMNRLLVFILVRDVRLRFRGFVFKDIYRCFEFELSIEFVEDEKMQGNLLSDLLNFFVDSVNMDYLIMYFFIFELGE